VGNVDAHVGKQHVPVLMWIVYIDK